MPTNTPEVSLATTVISKHGDFEMSIASIIFT